MRKQNWGSNTNARACHSRAGLMLYQIRLYREPVSEVSISFTCGRLPSQVLPFVHASTVIITVTFARWPYSKKGSYFTWKDTFNWGCVLCLVTVRLYDGFSLVCLYRLCTFYALKGRLSAFSRSHALTFVAFVRLVDYSQKHWVTTNTTCDNKQAILVNCSNDDKCVFH